ncbi:unnamed protein product [Cuscuta epithymum]|uniref:A20-type domain-containing protein n=1 Tax=Cuscuta epithymum TaxID=186058 RepID=A0AAV0CQA0_9ASTE|nr:unnamed protein product [Cuscuta epithymum]
MVSLEVPGKLHRRRKREFNVVPETIAPCANTCGVTGSPAINMCQKCFASTTMSSSSSVSGSSVAIPLKFSEVRNPRPPRSTFPRLSPARLVPDLNNQARPNKTIEKSDDVSTSAAKSEVELTRFC